MESFAAGRIWPEVLAELRERCGGEGAAVDRWLDLVRFLGEEGGAVHLAVPNRFALEWFERKYRDKLAEILARRLGRAVGVRLEVRAELQQSACGASAQEPAMRLAVGSESSSATRRAPETEDALGRRMAPSERSLRRRKPEPNSPALDDCVVGSCNRAFNGALQELLEHGRLRFNPLVVYGGTGLGKTHFLRAFHSELSRSEHGVTARYVTAERFVDGFVTSLHEGTINRFRDGMRSVDVLLFDDFHTLANKSKTREEFLYTLDAIVNSGAQAVIATAEHPKCLRESFGEALVTRLLAGLVVPLRRPDRETRLEILRHHVSRHRCEVDDDTLGLISDRVRGSVRELIGAANQVSAHARLYGAYGERLTPERVEELIAEVYREERARLHMEHVAAAVCRLFQLDVRALRSTRRERSVARARHVAIFLCRRYTDHSLSEIGAFFGRNASTARSSLRRVEELIAADGSIRRDLEVLEDALEGAGDATGRL